jgi:AcrR family transcriptional regulator
VNARAAVTPGTRHPDQDGGVAGPVGRGRPRDPTTDHAILQATLDLLTEVGVEGTTTNAIAARSGCSKSTIYRRWPSRDTLILDALRLAARGRPDDIRRVIELEQEIGSTLHAAALRAADTFRSRIFRAVLPTIAREMLADSPIGRQFREDVFVPIRIDATARLREAAERGQIAQMADLNLVFDLIYGGLLYRVLVGEPIDEEVAHALTELVLTGAAGPRSRSGEQGTNPGG